MAAVFSRVGESQIYWSSALPYLAAYAAASLLVMFALRSSGWWIWLGPVLLDPVAVFVIHWVALPRDTTGPAYMAVSVLILVALFAMLLLDAWVFLASALVCAVAAQGLLLAAGAGPGGYIGSGLVFLVLAFLGRHVVHRFLALADALAKERLSINQLERYFSPSVARQILQEGVAERPMSAEVTILFVDVRGFTSMSETMDPADVVAFLNRLHTRLVERVFELGGTLDKFMGDGALVYFGAPMPQADHAVRGVRCGLAILAEVEDLNRECEAHGRPGIRVGVGVHSGKVLVGSVGPPQRKEFTVIGDAVNVASRVEGLTKQLGSPLLVTDATRVLAGTAFSWEPVQEIEVRGRSESVRLWRPEEP